MRGRKPNQGNFPRAAGLGTRFLPATKAIPKEIMTLVDRPLIQYAIDGPARLKLGSRNSSLSPRAARALPRRLLCHHAPHGSNRRCVNSCKRTKTIPMHIPEIHLYGQRRHRVYQARHRALGLGHAVHCARRLIANEPFARSSFPTTSSTARTGLPQTNGRRLRGNRLMYGRRAWKCLRKRPRPTVFDIDRCKDHDGLAGLASKAWSKMPKAEEAPSNHAVIGRYILTPSVLRNL